MGMLWREELEGRAAEHHRRLNVVHVFREESEGDELDYELEHEFSETDDGECHPHLIPAGAHQAASHAR